MLFLILAIGSSAMVAIMMRLAQPRVTHPIGLLAANYIVCTLTALFLLKALATVPAVIAFPTCNVAVILVVTGAGILFFQETLSKKQVAGGILICIALVLLNL